MVRIFPRGHERGAELIEFAIVLPLLMLAFAGIMDFGLLFQRYLVVTNAAREGARIAVLPEYRENPVNVSNRVTAYMQEGLGDGSLACTADGSPCSTDVQSANLTLDGSPIPVPVMRVTVSLTHSYLVLGPVISLFGGGSLGSITLTARSTMRIE